MGLKTGISWTDATWNPIRGCSRVSEGCRNCYAETRAHRFSGPGLAYEGLVQLDSNGKSTGKWNGQIKFVEKHLLDPLKWKKPRRIFVNSMSDLFHENVTDEMRDRIVAVAAITPWHTMQCLTKRPAEALRYWTDPQLAGRIHALIVLMVKTGMVNAAHLNKLSDWHAEHGFPGNPLTPSIPLRNWQQGVSVEDQKTADERIPLLLQTPAAVRFISAEPLLGAIDLNEIEGVDNLDWIITGGESGHGARPMHPDWARSLRDWCVEFGVPFFFKQWGEWKPGDQELPFDHGIKAASMGPERVQWFQPDGRTAPCGSAPSGFVLGPANLTMRVGTKAAGCLLDGVEHHEFPAVTA
jgi:protein gp37